MFRGIKEWFDKLNGEKAVKWISLLSLACFIVWYILLYVVDCFKVDVAHLDITSAIYYLIYLIRFVVLIGIFLIVLFGKNKKQLLSYSCLGLCVLEFFDILLYIMVSYYLYWSWIFESLAIVFLLVAAFLFIKKIDFSLSGINIEPQKMSPKDALTALNRKRELGLISEEEYKKVREEILDSI
ncbi:MAG: hypothetical protein IKC31_06970 [Clostridia bacterium]|nr:hypothetical protein [Clostridia bacterium]